MEAMQIFITRNSQRYGPYSLQDIQAHLASGNLHISDMAWFEGAQGWVPLSQVPGIQVLQAAVPPPPSVSEVRRQNEPLKNPGLAAVLSLFFPGAGQVYNGQIGIGIFVGICTIALYVFGIGFFIHIWLIYDAYNYAKKLNEQMQQ